jgi:hypothetical protein
MSASTQAMSQPAAVTDSVKSEPRLQKIGIVLGRLALAYLFFTQLWWKTPPTFGCPANFAVTTAAANGQLQRTSGLCDWVGIESVWAQRPHPVFTANLDNQGPAEIAIDIGFLSRLNGSFVDGFVVPNIQWFGYVVWGMEAFIFVSLFFGVFSRLGALVAIFQSLQLWVGLAGISTPFEWEWSYDMFVVLSLMMFAFAPGRILGVDAILRPRLAAAAEKGNKFARVLAWLT